MNILIDDININYEMIGYGEPIIFLHGWEANHNTFNSLINKISDNYQLYLLDLPGFGESKIDRALNVYEVTDIINKFVIKLNLRNPIIIGHSYGGRIGIIYSSKYNVKGLILVSSHGVKLKKSGLKKIKIYIYKKIKKLGINLNIGSSDYKNSSGIKRKMLVDTVNRDLTKEMESINIPTLLIYGSNDNDTPIKGVGDYINNHIKNSVLITIDDSSHFVYLEKPLIVSLIINSFLEGI